MIKNTHKFKDTRSQREAGGGKKGENGGEGGGRERERERERDRQTDRQTVVVCWLLNVPATCECISGTDRLRQFYVLPH